MASELTPIILDHIKILDQFPPNLSLEQAHIYVETNFLPYFRGLNLEYDNQPRYPHISPRFSFAIAMLYWDIQIKHIKVLPNFNSCGRPNIDYFCQYCGNLVQSPFEDGPLCGLVLRRNQVLMIRNRPSLPAKIA